MVYRKVKALPFLPLIEKRIASGSYKSVLTSEWLVAHFAIFRHPT
jgi:hypothetical protein